MCVCVCKTGCARAQGAKNARPLAMKGLRSQCGPSTFRLFSWSQPAAVSCLEPKKPLEILVGMYEFRARICGC